MTESERIGKFGTLYNDDCLEIMKTFPDNHFTAICADPPYGLEFMGKSWDSFSNNTNSALGGQSPANKIENTPFKKRGKPIGGWCEKDRQANKNFQEWNETWAKEAIRICKPGAFMFIFGGTRTFHRLACGIEDAGWILRDTIMWVYGSGFPKGHDISKSIDKKFGKDRKIVGLRKHPTLKDTTKIEAQANAAHGNNEWKRAWDLTAPASEEATLFEGYNVALKPAYEPILVCMKPLDGTFANTALKWGVGGLNIDGGRISTEEKLERKLGKTTESTSGWKSMNRSEIAGKDGGRWPANLILQHSPDCVKIGTKKVKGIVKSNGNAIVNVAHAGGNIPLRRGTLIDRTDVDGNETIEDWKCSPSCPIALLNSQSGITKSGLLKAGHPYGLGDGQRVYSPLSGVVKHDTHADEGGAARFFLNLPPFYYCSKASRKEREFGCEDLPQSIGGGMSGTADQTLLTGSGNIRNNKLTNNHPTVKPLSLIKYLITLLKLPQTNLILDMFAGSGTLGVACEQLNLPYVLIEKETEYCDIIRARVKAAKQMSTKSKSNIKAKHEQPQFTLFDQNNLNIKEHS